MKAFELTGAALDWAVARCEGVVKGDSLDVGFIREGGYSSSTDWQQGGPIIEREKIELFMRDEEWFAYSSFSTPEDFHGDTPLIAAMRCYVASKLGDNINIPKELQ